MEIMVGQKYSRIKRNKVIKGGKEMEMKCNVLNHISELNKSNRIYFYTIFEFTEYYVFSVRFVLMQQHIIKKCALNK